MANPNDAMNTDEPGPKWVQRGAMLMLASALLFNLSTLGILALDAAQAGFQRAVGIERRVQATWLAEAALNLALARLSQIESPASLTLPQDLIVDELFAGGQLSVTVLNNPGDPGGAVDSDHILLLRATGVAPGGAARRTIESYVHYETMTMPWPGVLALAEGSTGTVQGNSDVNGHDADNPEVATAGIAYESPGQEVTTHSNAVSITGEPDFSWAAAEFTGTPGFSAQAQRVIDVLSARSSTVRLTEGDGHGLGTSSAPQVTLVDAGDSVTLSGKTSGAGVLIVRGTLHVSGQFKFEGVILIEDTTGSLKLTGNSTIRGAIAATHPRGAARGTADSVEAAGNMDLQYLQSACDMAAALVTIFEVWSYGLTT